MKNKIFIFTLVSIIVVSIFVVPCFAYSTSTDQEYTFKEDLDPSVFLQTSSLSLSIDFAVRNSSGVRYDSMVMSYRGYYVLTYENADVSITAWTSSEGWTSNSYREIVFIEDLEVSAPWSIFFEDNEYIPTFSVYGTIYDLLINNLFEGYEDDGFVRLSVTFCSVVLTLSVFVFAFVVVYFVLKLFINLIDRGF